jgi:phosphosulfolactate phosphohydrolase-like enzyme
VLSQLRHAGCELSTEAMATTLLVEATDVAAALRSRGSARELQAIGFAADVEIAAALDADHQAAVLRDGAFVEDRSTS